MHRQSNNTVLHHNFPLTRLQFYARLLPCRPDRTLRSRQTCFPRNSFHAGVLLRNWKTIVVVHLEFFTTPTIDRAKRIDTNVVMIVDRYKHGKLCRQTIPIRSILDSENSGSNFQVWEILDGPAGERSYKFKSLAFIQWKILASAETAMIMTEEKVCSCPKFVS